MRDFLRAQHVAHRGIGIGGGDEVGQAAAVVLDPGLHCALVEVLHPALGFIDGGALLGLIEQAHRRETLVARADGNRYQFDIRLQGEDETVFFDV